MNDELFIFFKRNALDDSMQLLGGQNGVECDTNSRICSDDGCTTKMEDTITDDGIKQEQHEDNYIDESPCES